MQTTKIARVGAIALVACLSVLLSSCKKDKTFKIERKWTVLEVTREGNPLENFFIKPGDEYEFTAKGEYIFRGAAERRGSYSFNLDNKELKMDGEAYYVYYAESKSFSFGLVGNFGDEYTLKLEAK